MEGDLAFGPREQVRRFEDGVALAAQLHSFSGFFIFGFFGFGWGALPTRPRILAGGAKPPQDPPLNGRSPHLIEAAKRGRLDQMIFFSAPLTTRAPPTNVRPDA